MNDNTPGTTPRSQTEPNGASRTRDVNDTPHSEASSAPRRPRTATAAPRAQSVSGESRPRTASNAPRLQAVNGEPRPQTVNNASRPQTLNGESRPRTASNVSRPQTGNIPPRAQNSTRPAEPSRLRSRSSRRSRASTVIGRSLLVIFTVIFILLFTLVALCSTLVNGPSETVRDKLVLSAMQASATKWLPGLFLDDEVVNGIVGRSEMEQPVTVPMGQLSNSNGTDTPDTGDEGNDKAPVGNDEGDDTVVTPEDPWANAIDGMIYKTYTGPSYKAYILIVKDPSRIYVGTSSNYKNGQTGVRMFDIVAREGAIAAINAGEFSDPNGQGTGNTPIGLTYSKGECVWDDGKKRTFIGFDNDGVLHAVESITKSQADALGIRDAVSFQTGNVLISNDGEQVTLHYSEGNVGVAQRTAIAQRADGAVILVVTDGRTASSLGATRNDIIDLLVSEGAVVAGMLDGGSSTMMYYEDYYLKYDIDTTGFDEYQLQGLTNRYKAFTKPRRMPTYFLVAPESTEG